SKGRGGWRSTTRCTGPAVTRAGTSCARSATRPTTGRATTRAPTRTDRHGPSSTSAAKRATGLAGHTWSGREGRRAAPARLRRARATSGSPLRFRPETPARWRWLPTPRTRPRAPRATPARRATPRATRSAPPAGRGVGAGGGRGDPLLEEFVPELGREPLYFADGQIHDEVYEYGSFRQSKMYQRGVRCTDCHDPHSAKLRAAGNALCVRCHQL